MVDKNQVVQEYLKKKKRDTGLVAEGTGPLAAPPFPGDVGYYGPELVSFPETEKEVESESKEGFYTVDALDPEKERAKAQDRIDTMLAQLSSIKADPANTAKWEARLKEADAKLEQARSAEAWKEIGSSIAAELAKVGAAMYGMKTGYNMAGLDLKTYSGEEGRRFAERQYEREVGKAEKEMAAEERAGEKQVERKIDVAKFKIKQLMDEIDADRREKLDTLKAERAAELASVKLTNAERKEAMKKAEAKQKEIEKNFAEAKAALGEAQGLTGKKANAKVVEAYGSLVKAGVPKEQLDKQFVNKNLFFGYNYKGASEIDISGMQPAVSTSTTPSQPVIMINPKDGKQYNVPADKVEVAKAKGWK